MTTTTARASGVEVVSPAPEAEWAELADADRHALAQQGPAWTRALERTGRWRDASRLYRLPDGRRAVLPLLARRGIDQGFPDGWGIGGPVGAEVDQSLVDAVLDDLEGRRDVLATRFRPDPTRSAPWAGSPRGVGVARTAHVVDLSAGADRVWDEGFKGNTRRAVRRALRSGVEVECDRTGALLPVLDELTARSQARWAETSREPLALARWRARRRDPRDGWANVADALGEGFRLWVARHEGRPVAAALVVVGHVAHYTRGAMDRDLAGPVRANHLLHWRAIEDAAASGCRTYHMGDSGTSESLARFKESLGARPVAYRDVRVERLPLTAADRWARNRVKRLVGVRDD